MRGDRKTHARCLVTVAILASLVIVAPSSVAAAKAGTAGTVWSSDRAALARWPAGSGTVGPEADLPGLHTPAVMQLHLGDLVTTRDGQHIENVDITGKLVVRHRNVTATNFRARRVAIGSMTNVDASASLSWCAVGDPEGSTSSYNGIGLGNYSVHRCDVFGAVDLVKLRYGYASVTESWLHDPVQWLVDPGQGGRPSHVDLFQTALGADVARIVIKDNRFDAWAFRQPERAGDTFGDLLASKTATGHVSLFAHSTGHTIHEVLIEGNLFDGNVYNCIYGIHDQHDAPFGAVRIVNNVFVRRYKNACLKQALSATSPSSIVWNANVDEHGAAVLAWGTRSS